MRTQRATRRPTLPVLLAVLVSTFAVCIGMLGSAPATAVPAAGGPATPSSAQSLDKIEGKLLDDLDDPGAEPFFIDVDGSADLAAASRIQDWAKRGDAVVRALRDTARASQADVIAKLNARGVDYQSFWVNNTIYVPSGTRSTALAVAGLDDVAEVRAPDQMALEKPVDQAATPDEDGVEWGVADIKANQVWDQFSDRGQGVVVANIDSGVQYDHPALLASYRGNLGNGQFDHDYNWWDPSKICAPGPSAPCDNAGHGSHTMGTMVGDGGPGNRIGVAPGAKWIAAKGCEFSSCSEFGLTSSAQWVLAPTDRTGKNPDASKRPDIVNNSWSGPGGNDWYEDFVRAWVASGIFPVFSNGNNGPACATTGAPGEYAEAYSVGDYTIDGTISDTSSRGPGSTGERKPNISAPGTDVRSSVPRGQYAVYSGTSMAAPHVAGTVALLWSAAPSLVGDIDATRQLLDDTARDHAGSECGGTTAANNTYGEGMLDALAVVSAAPRGDVGTVHGAVTEAGGDPVSGARVALSGTSSRSVLTKADGTYSIKVTPGTYDLEVTKFGFDAAHRGSISVSPGGSTTADVELTRSPVVTLSGTVHDRSGHGWPLPAKVSLPGTDLRTTSDPGSGKYSLDVPSGGNYEVQVEATYPGYLGVNEQVEVRGDTTFDADLQVDPTTCAAPGYGRGDGLRERFDSGAKPSGWTVVDGSGNGQTWTFDDARDNFTGGAGGFATVDSDKYGADGRQDTSLVSPTVDLSGVEHPVLDFGVDFKAYWFVRADVDLSVDGGSTWSNIWQATADVRGPRVVNLPLDAAAGKKQVQVRFHYYRASRDWWWQVDDVFIGDQACRKVPGGLLFGNTTDSLTGDPIDDAQVTSTDAPHDRTTSNAGSYWLFSSVTGKHAFTTQVDGHAATTVKVNVRPSVATRADFALRTGRLQVRPGGNVRVVVPAGHKVTQDLTIANTGDGPAAYGVAEHAPGGVATSSAGGSWTEAPIYPTPVKDNVAGYDDGRVYSFGGSTGSGQPLRASYVLDPVADQWRPIADLPQGRQKPAGGFVDGRFVITGGWGEGDLAPVAATAIYDPKSNTWSEGADNPSPQAASGSAVLDGRLYVIGGCAAECSGDDASNAVLRYDPAADRWTELADYPQRASWTACGGIGGRVYCTGGIGPGTNTQATYAYNPGTNAWRRVADQPLDLWASAVSVSADRLIVAGGTANRSSIITDEAFAYDPYTDEWSRLPDSNYALYRSAGACGFFKIGGSDGTFRGDVGVETLTGATDCAPWADYSWLDAKQPDGTIKAGHNAKLKVTFDARDISKPGTYRATLRIRNDTPYAATLIPVTMVVEAAGRH